MTAPVTTKAQAQAYRFGVRRLENAVATGESFRRTLGGPRHGLSFLIGVVLAALVLAGFAVYGFISPEPSIGDATVAVDTDNGGAYVVRDGRLYPALNYTSALLAAGRDTLQAGGSGSSGGAAGSGGKPKVAFVDSSTIEDMPKGRTLGITGAPGVLPGEDGLVGGSWTVCDRTVVDPAKGPSSPPTITTYAILGGRTVPQSAVGREAALVSADGGTTTFLLQGGRRAKLNLRDRAVGVALQTDGIQVRPVSAGLLAAIPRSADIVPPVIDGTGDDVSWSPDVTVGTVFAVRFAAGTAFYVALKDGAERVPKTVADLIRADAGSTAEFPVIPPSTLKKAPVSTAIDLTTYPTTIPKYEAVDADPYLCLDWTGAAGTAAYSVYPTTRLGLPKDAKPVPAPPGSGSSVADQVYLSPGKGEVVGQVVGNQKATAGALFFVGDNGVKYPVSTAQALRFLGLGKTVNPAPPALLNLLPTGPVLDPATAAAYYPDQSGG